MTLTPERIADMREALDADPDLDSVTSRRTTFLALLDAADKLARLTALLEPLRPLEAAAAPAPWSYWPSYGISPEPGVTLSFDGGCDDTEPPDDTAFVIAARNALAEMLRHRRQHARGAVEAASDPVIPMSPRPRQPLYHESPYRVDCNRTMP